MAVQTPSRPCHDSRVPHGLPRPLNNLLIHNDSDSDPSPTTGRSPAAAGYRACCGCESARDSPRRRLLTAGSLQAARPFAGDISWHAFVEFPCVRLRPTNTKAQPTLLAMTIDVQTERHSWVGYKHAYPTDRQYLELYF